MFNLIVFSSLFLQIFFWYQASTVILYFVVKHIRKFIIPLTVYLYVRFLNNKPENGWFKVSKNVLNLSKSELYLKISVIKVPGVNEGGL